MESDVKHVGFIMDGNRRFARKLMLEPWKGHEYGKEKLKQVLEWLKESNIQEATFYAFSMQNFNRPKKEFDYLMKVFLQACKELHEEELLKNKEVCIRFVGQLDKFPQNVQVATKKLMEKTRDYKPYTVNLAFGYGGRNEILDAVQKLALMIQQNKITPQDIDEDIFTKQLGIQSEPDFIIRTGGDRRTSNFLPWQSIYSEWFFVEKTWPDFAKEDFLACLHEFKKRERRFGK